MNTVTETAEKRIASAWLPAVEADDVTLEDVLLDFAKRVQGLGLALEFVDDEDAARPLGILLRDLASEAREWCEARAAMRHAEREPAE